MPERSEELTLKERMIVEAWHQVTYWKFVAKEMEQLTRENTFILAR